MHNGWCQVICNDSADDKINNRFFEVFRFHVTIAVQITSFKMAKKILWKIVALWVVTQVRKWREALRVLRWQTSREIYICIDKFLNKSLQWLAYGFMIRCITHFQFPEHHDGEDRTHVYQALT